MFLKLKEWEIKNVHSEKISTHLEAAFLKSSIWNGKAPQTKPVPMLLWITMKQWGETSRKIDYVISHVTFHMTFQCMFPAIIFESRESSQTDDERDSVSISTVYSLW